MTLEQLKKGLGNLFYKDLSRFEPGKQGIVIGENIRIAVEGDGFVVRFMDGLPPSQRKPTTDRLTQLGAKYTLGEDFVP